MFAKETILIVYTVRVGAVSKSNVCRSIFALSMLESTIPIDLVAQESTLRICHMLNTTSVNSLVSHFSFSFQTPYQQKRSWGERGGGYATSKYKIVHN